MPRAFKRREKCDTQGNRVAVIAADPAATESDSIATVTTRYAFDPDTNRLCGVLENATIALATPDPCTTDPGANGTATQNVWTEYAYDKKSDKVDLYNNVVGRKIGRDIALDWLVSQFMGFASIDRCKRALQDGQLWMVDPTTGMIRHTP